MSIILAVNPPYAGQLVDGIKTVEWRKRPIPYGVAFIYETKKSGGCGMVIGEIEIGGDWCVTANTASDDLIRKGMVDRDFLRKYGGANPIFANEIWSSARYKEPKPITAFSRYGDGDPLARAPQSWTYAEERENGNF